AVEGEGDRVESYFALRTIEIKEVGGKKRICLNGEPYFFHALLDQGYFPDGIFTPATPEAYKNDILEAKRLGFNTLRKHIKIEPQIFYYYCDKLGMVVFQDMVNNGHYSFLRDTALPTVAVKKMSDKLLHLNKKSREQFVLSMIETVKLLYNHPSICYWTIFNEGWGQFCSDEMYDLLKELDSTRVIDSTSGWFKNSKSDVESEHVYFKPYKFRSSDKAVVLSEFGGYSFRPEGHIFNLKKAYGDRFFTDRNEFENDLLRLYREEIIPAVKEGLCASVYTQLSDVEDETNGLLSYDRLVCKVDGKKMREIANELFEAVK
ncbi:MAG: glycoside hydrolase family 2, partial [Oscillospiraceae bacterium]|nr:glycoside hydrolase family 2 [Oscillospiraceae bacterium]